LNLSKVELNLSKGELNLPKIGLNFPKDLRVKPDTILNQNLCFDNLKMSLFEVLFPQFYQLLIKDYVKSSINKTSNTNLCVDY